nr:sigma-70 family RNA polymerase sigma factor [Pedobacter sp. ASV19]
MQIHKPSQLSLEKQYWLSLKNGNPDGLEMLYRLYSNPLYNYGSKFTADKDLIKECIQELFVNLWTRRTFISHPSDVKNYLFKSFRHSVFRKAALLQKNEEYQEAENYAFSVVLNMEDSIISAEQNEALKRRLEKAVSKLTDRQREAIFLKFNENLSYDEMADVMGISIKATYKIMARSLGFLREHLSSEDLAVLLSIFYLKLFD